MGLQQRLLIMWIVSRLGSFFGGSQKLRNGLGKPWGWDFFPQHHVDRATLENLGLFGIFDEGDDWGSGTNGFECLNFRQTCSVEFVDHAARTGRFALTVAVGGRQGPTVSR